MVNREVLSRGGMIGQTQNRTECYIEMAGKAVAEYFSNYERLKELYEMILADKGHIARCDVCYDVVDGVTIEEVKEAVLKGCVVSRSRQVRIVDSYENKIEGMESTGCTIYIGSRKSEKMLRIYDKAKQQEEGGRKVRFELQMRNDVAGEALKKLTEGDEKGMAESIIGLIYAYVDFRERDNENVSRRSQLGWYQELVVE